MRMFDLIRTEDATGISGTGQVAEGVVFSDGTCAMRWRTSTASTGFYDSVEDLIIIHGHGGKTQVVYHDELEIQVFEDGFGNKID